jgi:hypothetical protein
MKNSLGLLGIYNVQKLINYSSVMEKQVKIAQGFRKKKDGLRREYAICMYITPLEVWTH